MKKAIVGMIFAGVLIVISSKFVNQPWPRLPDLPDITFNVPELPEVNLDVQPRVVVQAEKFEAIRIIQRPTMAQGTGFFLSVDGKIYLVSANHVLQKNGCLYQFQDKYRVSVRLEIGDIAEVPEHDISFAEVTMMPSNFKIFRVAKTRGFRSDNVSSFGIAAGRHFHSHEGEIIKLEDEKSVYLTDMILIPGMSGGPLLLNGRVVGVNSMTSPYGISYHVDIDTMIEHLESLNSPQPVG